jgi:3'-5' exoribonuclease
MSIYVSELRELARKYELNQEVMPLVEAVLTQPEFAYWSGSAYSYHHHYGHGGLARHTCEVVKLCMLNRDALGKMEMNKEELFLAALYHDLGKMYDYQLGGMYGNEWKPTEHKRLIHHISRSALLWSHALENHAPDLYNKYHDTVLHAILAHHGSRQFGSPVAPKSQVSWMLHLCDSISARMDDWNKMDVVDKDKGKV